MADTLLAGGSTQPTGHQIDLTGGESVYCINTFQIQKASELYSGEGEASERIRSIMSRLETDLSRNEQAAIAMLILQKLNSGFPG